MKYDIGTVFINESGRLFIVVNYSNNYDIYTVRQEFLMMENEHLEINYNSTYHSFKEEELNEIIKLNIKRIIHEN